MKGKDKKWTSIDRRKDKKTSSEVSRHMYAKTCKHSKGRYEIGFPRVARVLCWYLLVVCLRLLVKHIILLPAMCILYVCL